MNCGSHEISPPMVTEFVRKKITICSHALLYHKARIGDVCRHFQGSICSENIPHSFPGIRPPPVLECIDGISDVNEFICHEVDVFRFGGKPNRDVPVFSCMDEVAVDIAGHSKRSLVSCDWVLEYKASR